MTERAQVGGLKLTGDGGLLGKLTKMVIEGAPEGEMDGHLGYARHDPAGHNSGNSRNGHRARTVLTEAGPVEIPVISEANQKAIEAAGLSFILGMKIPDVPCQVGKWRREHPGEDIPDGHVFTQPWPARPSWRGAGSGRRRSARAADPRRSWSGRASRTLSAFRACLPWHA